MQQNKEGKKTDMYMDLVEWIENEKQSDDLNRRLAAHLLDEAYDMDWIGMSTEDIGGDDHLEGLIKEIRKSEWISQLLQRIYGEE